MKDWHEDFLFEYKIGFPNVTNKKIKGKQIFKGISLPVVKHDFEEYLKSIQIPPNVEFLKITVKGNTLLKSKKLSSKIIKYTSLKSTLLFAYVPARYYPLLPLLKKFTIYSNLIIY